MSELRFEWLHPDAVEPNPLNWRKHPERQTAALDTLIFSKDGVGWAGVVLINERRKEDGWPKDATPTIIDGHARHELALERGEAIPTIIGSWSSTQEKTILATLDPLAALAETNADALEALLVDVEIEDPAVQALFDDLAAGAGIEFGPNGTGPVEEGPEPKLDRSKELRKKWKTEPGQLWEIPSLTFDGKAHRLLSGDCTDTGQVEQLMDGKRATLFATDPPYLVDYDGTNHPHKWNEPDKNKDWSETYEDWDSAEQGEELYDGFIATALQSALIENAAWYCWHASRNQAMLESVWEKYGAFVHQQIIWMKDRAILTRSWYMWQHEPCFFGWVRGKKPKRVASDYPASVWQIPTILPGKETIHPTSKPVELFAIPMRQHTDRGDICYEPFAGSGSQYLAAEQLSRLCFGLEISPEYCAVILERLTEFGLSPRLVNDAAT